MTDRRIVHTSDAPSIPLPISQGVAHHGVLYLGGQAGFDPATNKLVSESFDDQLRQALRNLEAVARAGGASLSQALKVTVYVDDIGRYAAMNAIYAEVFHHHPPARKVIQCQLLPGILAEVDAIVALPGAAAAPERSS